MKEYSFKTQNGTKIVIGTLNKDKCRVIYINTTFWLTPLDNFAFEEDFATFKKKFKDSIINFIYHNKMYNYTYLYDFDAKTKYMQVNKRSYVAIELVLQQKSDKTFKEIAYELYPYINTVIDNLQKYMIDSFYKIN